MKINKESTKAAFSAAFYAKKRKEPLTWYEKYKIRRAIAEKIQKACKLGERECTIDELDLQFDLLREVKKHRQLIINYLTYYLIGEGFKVKICDEFNDMVISWEHIETKKPPRSKWFSKENK